MSDNKAKLLEIAINLASKENGGIVPSDEVIKEKYKWLTNLFESI